MRGQRVGKGYESSYQIEGLEKLIHTLESLPSALQQRVVKAAVMEAFQPALAACIAGCPEGETKKLKASLRIEVRKNKSGGYTALVVAGDEDGKGDFAGVFYYLGMIEYGTEKMLARPFMRTGFDSTKDQVQANLKRLMKAGIMVEFRRAA